MGKITIAIDGYSACGKSTTAKVVAKELGYTYIDSGAMYRAVTLYFMQNHVKLTNPKEVEGALDQVSISFRINDESDICDTYLNGLNVENDIRQMKVSERVSEVSAIAAVREAMVSQQRKLGKQRGVVMDGRDIGTVVFPDAQLKVFMVAEFYIRGERRQRELLERGEMIDLEKVTENLKKRDHLDSTREESPLRKADDAIIVDTTNLIFEEQVEEVLNLATARIAQSLYQMEHKG
jgi:cytidylate kinase